MQAQKQKDIKFSADHMLGRLSRWLRILGYDTDYPPPGPDKELIESAGTDNRILLTRDKTVAETKKARVIYIKSDRIEEQLMQLAEELSLELDANLKEEEDGSLVNRCGVCNGILKPLPAEAAKEKVPEGVKAHIDKYWQCAGCNKIYWEGSHWDQIKERIEKIKKSR
ncbi:MAG: Mut7-C RNAse domain-containing protein [Thermoplasmata archaeon]|nr:MAG: Mut7-C RNAse domain-containing protein [Thermoplasmata archaeon]